MKFLFKYPTRQRPETFQKILNRYYAFLSDKHEYEFIVSLDEDDKTMNNKPMRNFLKGKDNLHFYYGQNKSKIQAINADMEKAKSDWDILFLISDDMRPKVKGFDDIIAQNMSNFFPEKDGFLHYNDGRVGKKIATLSVIGRKLYEQWGYIYHPDYISLWCDNEQTEVAKKMKKHKYFDIVLVHHDWHGGKKDKARDALYNRNEGYFNIDKKMYEKRKKYGFPRNSVKKMP